MCAERNHTTFSQLKRYLPLAVHWYAEVFLSGASCHRRVMLTGKQGDKIGNVHIYYFENSAVNMQQNVINSGPFLALPACAVPRAERSHCVRSEPGAELGHSTQSWSFAHIPSSRHHRAGSCREPGTQAFEQIRLLNEYLHHQASGRSHPLSSSAHTQNNLGRTTLLSAFCLSSPQKASGRQPGNLQYCLSKFLLEINHSYWHLNTLKSPKQKSAFQWYDFQNGYIHCEAVKEK